MKTRSLWIGFTTVVTLSFAVLLFFGHEIYRQKPPIPKQVLTPSGEVLMTEANIRDGQNVWQSTGGQELGTIWGHGSYQAPDWTADYLHREAMFILDAWARETGAAGFEAMGLEQQAGLQARLKQEIRTNSYDTKTGNLVVSEMRAKAYKANSEYYAKLFIDDPSMTKLRDAYAMKDNTVKDPARMQLMGDFFFWATWATSTNRPDQDVTYSNNWPPEKLIDNVPAPSLIFWTGFSVIILLAGIGLLAWFQASRKEETLEFIPDKNPTLGTLMTPSMKATLKYFWIVTALILVQILMGVITAHYSVEGQAFYGLPLSKILPYSLSRTWHIQLAIFWIATSWLATGLFYAPVISGHEPKYQKLGVNLLFGALLVIVVGSLAGQFMAIMQKLGLVQNFWFGHQGYEYVDLGRFWQIFLFAGLFIWLFLITRAIIPALKKKSESRSMLIMFVIASLAIAAFYGAGLMWGRQTNLAMAEYWRWWVVHLWVEGFFEVFATVIIAFLFVRMQLVRPKTATTTVLFSTIIFLSGGILGTFHHLYFTGTPTGVLALGATFSALEVVPLVLIGFEAWHNLRLSRAHEWIRIYRWPIYSFIAVAFWNLVGAGIFGFLINPPIALYYMQGLNTTPVHGHTALFGVYGMLGIGLMLFVLREMDLKVVWKEGALKWSFWLINIGLLTMVLISVLPVGLAQTIAAVKHGLWYARSAEFLHTPLITTFRWMRMFGDILFSAGALCLAWFVFGLKLGWSVKK